MKDLRLLLCVAITALTLAIGCTPQQTAQNDKGSESQKQDAANKSKDHNGAEHTHAPGPHGGVVIDWGGGTYHVELVFDHDKQEVTAYILGADEKTPQPVDSQEIVLAITDPAFQVTLKPSAQEGDSEGNASRFVGTDERLATAQEYAGSLSGAVGETPYSGKFDEASHGHDH